MDNSLHDQIKKARENVRRLKETMPHMFPEYNRLLLARQELEVAEEEYDAALAEWNRLGEDK